MISEAIHTFFLQLKDVFANFDFFADTLDILLVALIIYGLITQLRKTQSIQVVKGIILLAIAYGLVSVIGMKTSSYVFSKLFSDIIIIFVVIFSSEIRQVLEHLGKRKISNSLSFLSTVPEEEEIDAINAVCRACGAMSRSKVGSLIVFQRNTLLGDLTKQAVPIDAETTYEMVCSIFYPKAPLHDGAIIIKNGRIVAARCVVPMKNDREISENVGTRHRAALEVSLNSDAVAVVTSEETGLISVAVDGQLKRGITDSKLREMLGGYLLSDSSEKPQKKLFFTKRKKPQQNVEQDENIHSESVTEEISSPEESNKKEAEDIGE